MLRVDCCVKCFFYLFGVCSQRVSPAASERLHLFIPSQYLSGTLAPSSISILLLNQKNTAKESSNFVTIYSFNQEKLKFHLVLLLLSQRGRNLVTGGSQWVLQWFRGGSGAATDGWSVWVIGKNKVSTQNQPELPQCLALKNAPETSEYVTLRTPQNHLEPPGFGSLNQREPSEPVGVSLWNHWRNQ